MLDGFALLVTDGPAAAAPLLRRATSAFTSPGIPEEETLRAGFIATVADEALWDDKGWRLTVRQVQLARDVGALDQLSFLLNRMAIETVWSGDFAAATLLIAEARRSARRPGSFRTRRRYHAGCVPGRKAEAIPLVQSIIEQAIPGGQGVSATVAHWVAAVLYNGLGRYEEALAAARQASEHKHVYVSVWALPELIEAAARTGDMGIAGDALDLLTETTRAGGTDLGLGIEARTRALLSEGEAAEGHYREAIERLGRPGTVPSSPAPTCCTASGGAASAAAATPGTSCAPPSRCSTRWGWKRSPPGPVPSCAPPASAPARADPGTPEVLTAQEEQIARLVAEHLSNREIAARLFISASTVEYHLRKIFRKLDVSNRAQLARTFRRRQRDPPAQQY